MADELDNPNLTDDQVADAYISQLPPTMRLALGENLKALIKNVTDRERKRCARILHHGVRYQEHLVQQVEAQATAAIAAGQVAQAEQLSARREPFIQSAKALAAAVKIIMQEPGSCRTCGGSKMAPTNIVLAGGQRPMVPCPACVRPAQSEGSATAVSTAAATSAPSASSSSNGTPSSNG
jgi:hypothetical protein